MPRRRDTLPKDAPIEVRDGGVLPPFFPIVHVLLDSGALARVGPTATLVYIAVGRHTRADNPEAFPSVARLATLTGLGQRTVRRAINRLEEARLIAVTKRASPRTGWRQPSVLTLLPIARTEGGQRSPVAVGQRPPVATEEEAGRREAEKDNCAAVGALAPPAPAVEARKIPGRERPSPPHLAGETQPTATKRKPDPMRQLEARVNALLTRAGFSAPIRPQTLGEWHAALGDELLPVLETAHEAGRLAEIAATARSPWALLSHLVVNVAPAWADEQRRGAPPPAALEAAT